MNNKKTAMPYLQIHCGLLEYLGWESNPHSLKNWILNPARLPIPPPRQIEVKIVNYLFCQFKIDINT